jgi:acyl-CoA reductase-like NAD-dependent aldehyde dehydrogenase
LIDAELVVPAVGLPDHWHFARNLVDGQWCFPAAPYDYEIRSPSDGTVTTVVPLSSRLDVGRAVAAAERAAPGWAADPALRGALLDRLVAALGALTGPLAVLSAAETGLGADDALSAMEGVVGVARTLTEAADRWTSQPTPGVSGHVLGWGLPAAEAVFAALPQLAAGRTVVLAPSLRAPLSAVALAHLATAVGFPPGVLGLVQGTGPDVGAALHAHAGLSRLQVRAGERTLAHASRATARTGVSLYTLRAGGNVGVVGPEADRNSVASAAVAVADALRVHSAGGPLSLPLLAVHADRQAEVVDAVLAAVVGDTPAPLPTEALRRRALDRVEVLRAAGARLIRGGVVPDDADHRMGWRIPATILTMPTADAPPGEPLGPILTILPWRHPSRLAAALRHPRHTDGIARTWGLSPTDTVALALPHPVTLHEAESRHLLTGHHLPPGWL